MMADKDGEQDSRFLINCCLCKVGNSKRFFELSNKKCSDENIISKLNLILHKDLNHLNGYICSACLLKVNKTYAFIRSVAENLNLCDSFERYKVTCPVAPLSHNILHYPDVSVCDDEGMAICCDEVTATRDALSDHGYTVSQQKKQPQGHTYESSCTGYAPVIYNDEFILSLISLLVNGDSSKAASLILSSGLRRSIEECITLDVRLRCEDLCKKSEPSVLRAYRPLDELVAKSENLIPDILNEFLTR